jgi:hypothetical protein
LATPGTSLERIRIQQRFPEMFIVFDQYIKVWRFPKMDAACAYITAGFGSVTLHAPDEKIRTRE